MLKITLTLVEHPIIQWEISYRNATRGSYRAGNKIKSRMRIKFQFPFSEKIFNSIMIGRLIGIYSIRSIYICVRCGGNLITFSYNKNNLYSVRVEISCDIK